MPKSIASIAAVDIGLEELPIGSNHGPDLQKFFKADDLDIDGKTDGYPWCAAAVSFWTQEFLKKNNIASVKPPRIAAVRLFEEWAKKNSLPISNTPKKNSIVVFNFSHIGVVEGVDDYGNVVCIEGNTNDDGSREGYEVCRKHRNPDSCKFFIHLPEV
jgi:hypothetical protein